MIDDLTDDFGPEALLEVNFGVRGLSATLVADNTLLGPCKGGLRIMPSITEEDVCKLSRICTYRNALMELPYGGGRAVIRCEPNALARDEKEIILRSFARSIKRTLARKHVFEPDLNTGAEEMMIIADELGSWSACAGKPAEYRTRGGRKAGIPHHPEIVSLGLFHAMSTAASHLGLPLRGSTISVIGLGEVGRALAVRAEKDGADVISTNNVRVASEEAPGKISKSLGQMKLSSTELQADIQVFGIEAQAMTEDQLRKIDSRIVIEGEDLVLKDTTKEDLFKRGILVVPDVVSNSGGTITSFYELKGIKMPTLPLVIERKVVKATIEILERASLQGMAPDEAAKRVAQDRLGRR